MMDAPEAAGGRIALRRRVTLPLLVLYGVGVTVGAGIYVLIGAMVRHAGAYAPLAFVLAAIVMGLTAAAYAELCGRFPVSAAEAAYVKRAFGSRPLSTVTGGLSIVIGIVSSAAVAIGAAGYIQEFVDLPQSVIVTGVVLVLGLIAAYGILESVLVAALFTLVEVGGLVAIIVAGFGADLDLAGAASFFTLPPADMEVWAGLAAASLLAFFAFVGFEDLANIAEEAQAPERTLPRAIVLTLIITTVLYVLVVAVAVLGVPPDRLAASSAPLSLVFREVAGLSPTVISLIAIVATLNTVLVQLTMATRVIYGMARLGDLPAALGDVHARTATPLVATAIVTGFVLVLAVSLPIEQLAEWTSLATLVVFALVNAALLAIKRDAAQPPSRGVVVPYWVPVAGLVTCVGMIASAFL